MADPGVPEPGTLLDRPVRSSRAGRWPTWASRHLPVLAPAALALVLSAWRFDAKPLWRDEIYTLITSGRSLDDMFELLLDRDAGLSVYYTLMHGWMLVSTDPGWVRAPSAVATVAAVALTAAVGRRVGGDPVAVVAGVLAALSSALLIHAQEARPYPLVIAAVVGTALLALRAAELPRRTPLVALTGVATLAVGLHPLVAVPAVAVIIGALWLRPGRATRAQVTLAALPPALLGLGLVAAGALQAAAARPPHPMPLWRLWTFWKIIADVPAPGVVVAVLALAGAVLLRGRRRDLLMVGAWAAAPVAAVSVLGLSGSYFNPRYASASAPALCLLAACGIVMGARRWAQAKPSRDGARAVRVAVAASLLVTAATLGPGAVAFRSAAYDFDDAPSAAAQLVSQDRPGDVVVFTGSVSRPLLATYLPSGELVSDELDDVLLAPGSYRSDTRGGQEVPVRERETLLAGRSRVWLVGTMAVATDDLSRGTASARAAMSGREMVSRTDHGHVRVELWATSAP